MKPNFQQILKKVGNIKTASKLTDGIEVHTHTHTHTLALQEKF